MTTFVRLYALFAGLANVGAALISLWNGWWLLVLLHAGLAFVLYHVWMEGA